jgi:hypothetical protein
LPFSPGRAERHGFEYYRHGTLSLYAFFNTKTGEVFGKTAAGIPRRSSLHSSLTSSPTNRVGGVKWRPPQFRPQSQTRCLMRSVFD